MPELPIFPETNGYQLSPVFLGGTLVFTEIDHALFTYLIAIVAFREHEAKTLSQIDDFLFSLKQGTAGPISQFTFNSWATKVLEGAYQILGINPDTERQDIEWAKKNTETPAQQGRVQIGDMVFYPEPDKSYNLGPVTNIIQAGGDYVVGNKTTTYVYGTPPGSPPPVLPLPPVPAKVSNKPDLSEIKEQLILAYAQFCTPNDHDPREFRFDNTFYACVSAHTQVKSLAQLHPGSGPIFGLGGELAQKTREILLFYINLHRENPPEENKVSGLSKFGYWEMDVFMMSMIMRIKPLVVEWLYDPNRHKNYKLCLPYTLKCGYDLIRELEKRDEFGKALQIAEMLRIITQEDEYWPAIDDRSTIKNVRGILKNYQPN